MIELAPQALSLTYLFAINTASLSLTIYFGTYNDAIEFFIIAFFVTTSLYLQLIALLVRIRHRLFKVLNLSRMELT